MRRTHWIVLTGLVVGLLTAGLAQAQTPEIPSCLSAPAPRLRHDFLAAVVPGTPPVILRDEPTFRSNRLGTLTPGASFRVVNGPVCADGIIWWKVSSAGVDGWAAEGQNGDYFLMPYQPEPLATAEAGQVTVRHKGVYFTLDSALAPAVAFEPVEVIPYNPDAGWPEFIAPAGIKYTFFDDTQGSIYPRSALTIYPAQGFVELYEEQGEKIEALKAMIAGETAGADGEIPEVPGRNARQMIRASIKYLDFPDGKGVRYLTYYAQALYPATNRSLYYEFRGFSGNGNRNYVHLQYALRATILPEEIINPQFWKNDDFAQYSANLTRLLTDLPADQFNPNLDLLDALAQSIKVGNG